MGFDVTPELQAKIDTVRDFVRTELYPLEPQFLTRPFDELLPTIKPSCARR